MTSTPTLAMPNFNEPFVIETDVGIGAIPTQQGKPIAFMSWALGMSKKPWSTYAKEMLVIFQAIQTRWPYLLGWKFYIHTDQYSLKYLLEQRIATPKQQKWVAKLLGYDYEICYKLGRENSTTDALLRLIENHDLDALFMSKVAIWEEIKKKSSSWTCLHGKNWEVGNRNLGARSLFLAQWIGSLQKIE